VAVFLIYRQHSQILFQVTARFGSYGSSFRNVVSVENWWKWKIFLWMLVVLFMYKQCQILMRYN